MRAGARIVTTDTKVYKGRTLHVLQNGILCVPAPRMFIPAPLRSAGAAGTKKGPYWAFFF